MPRRFCFWIVTLTSSTRKCGRTVRPISAQTKIPALSKYLRLFFRIQRKLNWIGGSPCRTDSRKTPLASDGNCNRELRPPTRRAMPFQLRIWRPSLVAFQTDGGTHG